MRAKQFPRRSLAERALRLNLAQPDIDNAFSLPPGGITLTITHNPQTTTTTSATPTTTTIVTVPPTTTSSSSTSVLSPVPGTSSSALITPSVSALPLTSSSSSSSVKATGVMSAQDSGAVTTKTLPAGAIVGIIIAVLVVILAAAFFLVRKRYMQNRNNRRATWTTRPGISYRDVGSSFFPGESRDTIPPTVFPKLAQTREVSSGAVFASAQASTMAAWAAVPSVPPPPTTYNNPAVGVVNSRTVPAALPAESGVVKFTFEPTLADELRITNGEIIRILQEYDDGWALCMNGRNVKGMVPLECLERVTGSGVANADQLGVPSDHRMSRRDSSLGVITVAR